MSFPPEIFPPVIFCYQKLIQYINTSVLPTFKCFTNTFMVYALSKHPSKKGLIRPVRSYTSYISATSLLSPTALPLPAPLCSSHTGLCCSFNMQSLTQTASPCMYCSICLECCSLRYQRAHFLTAFILGSNIILSDSPFLTI